jgi:hypothetical protein
MLAIGPYVEGGYQRLPADAGYPMLGVGLQARIPAMARLLCCGWDFSGKKSKSSGD